MVKALERSPCILALTKPQPKTLYIICCVWTPIGCCVNTIVKPELLLQLSSIFQHKHRLSSASLGSSRCINCCLGAFKNWLQELRLECLPKWSRVLHCFARDLQRSRHSQTQRTTGQIWRPAWDDTSSLIITSKLLETCRQDREGQGRAANTVHHRHAGMLSFRAHCFCSNDTHLQELALPLR